MFDLTKFTFPTAVQAVEKARETATIFSTYIPNEEVKDIFSTISNANLKIATMVAEKYDDGIEQAKKYFSYQK